MTLFPLLVLVSHVVAVAFATVKSAYPTGGYPAPYRFHRLLKDNRDPHLSSPRSNTSTSKSDVGYERVGSIIIYNHKGEEKPCGLSSGAEREGDSPNSRATSTRSNSRVGQGFNSESNGSSRSTGQGGKAALCAVTQETPKRTNPEEPLTGAPTIATTQPPTTVPTHADIEAPTSAKEPTPSPNVTPSERPTMYPIKNSTRPHCPGPTCGTVSFLGDTTLSCSLGGTPISELTFVFILSPCDSSSHSQSNVTGVGCDDFFDTIIPALGSDSGTDAGHDLDIYIVMCFAEDMTELVVTPSAAMVDDTLNIASLNGSAFAGRGVL